MNYKFYTYVTKSESASVDDVEGHTMRFYIRRAFWVFENGEVGTSYSVGTSDYVKLSGPFMQYQTISFQDGSTIIVKNQGTTATTTAGTSSQWRSEIIKGTGRFEGIKGTQSAKGKFLPVEKGEVGPKGYGEGMITYTLPAK